MQCSNEAFTSALINIFHTFCYHTAWSTDVKIRLRITRSGRQHTHARTFSATISIYTVARTISAHEKKNPSSFLMFWLCIFRRYDGKMVYTMVYRISVFPFQNIYIITFG